MKKLLNYIILFLFFGSLNPLFAQLKPCITYNEDNGLAGNVVNCIIKNNNGILWIATDDGLSKFDGEKFQNLYKTNGLPSNRVRALAIDDNNNLYAACYQSGLALIKNDSIVNVFHTTGKFPNSFRTLHYSSYYKMVLAGTDYGLYLLKGNKLITVIHPKDLKFKSSITSISEQGSRIFFTMHTPGGGGLYELFINKYAPEKSYAKFIASNGRFSSLIMNDTIYTAGYCSIFSNPLNKITDQKIFAKVDTQFFVWKIVKYDKTHLLLGGMGEKRFRGDLIKFNLITHKEEPIPYALNANGINSIFIDQLSNVTWIGANNGLSCLFDSPFEIYNQNNANEIIDINFQGDTLFVLTKNNVQIFRDKHCIQKIDKNIILNRISSEYKKLKARYNKDVSRYFGTYAALELSDLKHINGKLFVQTTQGLVSIPDLKTFHPFGIGSLLIKNQSEAYISLVYENLRQYYGKMLLRDYTEPKSSKGKLTDIFKIIEANNILYLCTNNNGIYAIKDTKVYYLDENNSSIDNNLSDMVADDAGHVWCSSINCNLFQIGFNDSPVLLKTITPDSTGLIGDNCKWLIFNNKNLFVSTNKGLNIISTASLYSKKPEFEFFYNQYNGYEWISATSPVKDKSGNIYVHTPDKIIRINGYNFYKSFLNVNYRNVELNGVKIEINRLKGTKLPFSAKNISFEFFVTKYPNAHNIVYRYRINNSEWITGSQINLQSIRPGNYNIRMEVYNKEDHQTYCEAISFKVKTPFWQTWWFVLAIIMLLSALISRLARNYYKAKENKLNEKVEREARFNEIKLRSVQLQMNPHFIFNALTSVQGLLLAQNKEDSLINLGNWQVLSAPISKTLPKNTFI